MPKLNRAIPYIQDIHLVPAWDGRRDAASAAARSYPLLDPDAPLDPDAHLNPDP